MAKKKSVPKKPSSTNGSYGPLKDLKELYAFMQDNSLQSLELNRKDFHVRLVRKGAATTPVAVPVAIGGAPLAAAPAAAPGAPAAAPAADVGLPANTIIVKSPMMGVFYRASSPSSPPFVKEGDTVKTGDVIGLIEAMKVFNDVKAEISGKVVKTLIENGKPVKVGQPIFWIEKA